MYRSLQSTNPTAAIRFELEARGIVDHATALPVGSRTKRVDVFVMADGSVVKADSRTVSEIARDAGRTERARRAYLAR